MDRKPNKFNQADLEARAALAAERRAKREQDTTLIKAEGDPGFGYRDEEIPLVLELRAKRGRWRALGKEAEELMNAETQAWINRFNEKYKVVETIEIFDEKQKTFKKRENLVVAEPANFYRAVRAFAGSTLDKGVKYHEEFDLPDEFAMEKLVAVIEAKIVALKSTERGGLSM